MSAGMSAFDAAYLSLESIGRVNAMLKTINELRWGPGTLALLLGSGVFLTLRLRFLPWRNLGYALRSALGREARQAGRNGVSPFSALMTALAATIGTGNIVGVATALAAGGPGALVWMEVSALFGMALTFSECTLAVKYRRRDRRGAWCGGPMYVMSAALGRPGRWMAAVFSAFAAAASLGIGSMTQANSIAGALGAVAGTPARLAGLVTAGLALVMLLGGIRSISRVTSVLVPVMAALYLAAGLAVILGNLPRLPAGLAEIFRCALSPQAAAAGTLGTALRWGVARGVFSNEAGLGSAAIAAAAAETDSPVRQGYIGMTGVFFDTLVICTVTGLAICCSGVLGTVDAAGAPVDGAVLTILAFQTVLGRWGAWFIGVSIVLFAFSTILGWAYQGEQAFAYLSGGRGLGLYRAAFALAALLGVETRPEAVFLFSDVCNALMCIPNLLCLLLLSGTVVREARGSGGRKW